MPARAAPVLTAWDVRVFARALGLAAALFVVTCLASGATDEGGVAWATRVARAVPVLPLCGAVATYVTLRTAARRGELLALAAIGRSFAQNAQAAVAGGACAGMIAAAVLAVPSGADVSTFFPRVVSDDVVAQDAGFVDRSRGVRIDEDGTLSRVAAAAIPSAPLPAGGRASAALVVALAALALPALGARAAFERAGRAIGAAGLAAGACIVLLHAAAAGGAPAWLATLPLLALLGVAAIRYRAPAWTS